MLFCRNEIDECVFNQINTAPFGSSDVWKCEIPADFSGGSMHPGILRNFAQALINGTKLLSPGEDGIKGLTISNAMHLSAWTGTVIDLNEFSDDRFYALLQDRINHSTIVKNVKQVVADTSKSY